MVGALAVGCSAGGEQNPELLEGKTWVAVEINPYGDTVGSGEVESSAVFEDSAVGGNGGVNSYSGVLDVSADGKMTITEIVSTLMAGPEPAMSQETAFFDALARVERFEVTESELVLADGSGNQLILFEVSE